MDWKEENNQLRITYRFKRFEDAMSFMFAMTPHISKMDHHPTWQNTYNTVTVSLQTHDAGNVVTDKDRKLAILMDQEFANYS